MVVKPMAVVGKDKRGLVQPAVKRKGAEYLLIIYGPEYTGLETLEPLRNRGLSSKKATCASGVCAGHRGPAAFCGTGVSLQGS